MKILVVSDVHGDIDKMKEILNQNSDVDVKVFCGDLQFNDEKIIKENFDYYVSGNIDYFKFDEIKEFEVDKVKILLTHGHLFEEFWTRINFDKLFELAALLNAKIILHGHDHVRANEEKNSIFRFNPGSMTFPRGDNKKSYGIITVKNGKVISLEHKFLK